MATTIRLRGGIVILEPSGKIIGTAISELREKLASQLYPINLIRSLLIKSALRGTGTSRYKWG